MKRTIRITLIYLLIRALYRDLTRTQKLFEEIFERIPVMVTIYNAQVGRVRVNNTFETLTGYSREQIDEIDLMAACYPDPEVRAAAVEWMRKSNRKWKEFELTTRAGEKRRQEWSNLRLDNDTFIGVGIDMELYAAIEW